MSMRHGTYFSFLVFFTLVFPWKNEIPIKGSMQAFAWLRRWGSNSCPLSSVVRSARCNY